MEGGDAELLDVATQLITATRQSMETVVALDDDPTVLTSLGYLMAPLQINFVCCELRADPRYQSLPVIFMTDRTDPETLTAAFAARANDFVRKPVVQAELVARIGSRLERARLLRQIMETDGHAIGDTVLQRLVVVLRDSLRGEDVVGRFGGEEFAIAMFGATKEAAANRLQQLMAKFSADPLIQFSGSTPELAGTGGSLRTIALSSPHP